MPLTQKCISEVCGRNITLLCRGKLRVLNILVAIVK